MSEWWRTQCHFDRFFSQYFSFPPSVSLHQCCLIIFILILLLSEGQAGEAWAPSNKTALFRISEHWPLKMGQTGCPETSVRNYYYSLPDNAEKRCSQGTFTCDPSLQLLTHSIWGQFLAGEILLNSAAAGNRRSVLFSLWSIWFEYRPRGIPACSFKRMGQQVPHYKPIVSFCFLPQRGTPIRCVSDMSRLLRCSPHRMPAFL